jgi:soluble lytic murein transglycosylase
MVCSFRRVRRNVAAQLRADILWKCMMRKGAWRLVVVIALAVASGDGAANAQGQDAAGGAKAAKAKAPAPKAKAPAPKAKAPAPKAKAPPKAAPATPAPPRRPSAAASALGAGWSALDAGDYPTALRQASNALKHKDLLNRDYALYVAGQAAFASGDFRVALGHFTALGQQKGSRFAASAPWRAADCRWELGEHQEARAAYKKLLGASGGDDAVARFRIGAAQLEAGQKAAALETWRDLALLIPDHPLADRALESIVAQGGAPLTARERISRASRLTTGRSWTQALAELAWVADDEPEGVRTLRDFHLGNTLFKMRRQYARAGRLLIAVHDKIGGELAAYALFHGARGLSRGDRDDEAIGWYKEVVRKYPSSEWAAEAQFLSGWLEYNRGQFRACIPGLEGLLAKYPRSKFADDALWYLGYSHYLLGDYDEALRLLGKLADQGGELVGGKGRYWHARTLDKLGKSDEAKRELRQIPSIYPLSWYAILARAQLAARGIVIGPFGDRDGAPADVPALGSVDGKVAADAEIAKVDELIAAGLDVEAGVELTASEKALFKRYGAARALPVVLDRYARAGNFNRPWMLAEVYGDRAFRGRPEGAARAWWEHSYPQAFRPWVEKYQHLGQNPPYYLYAIMRKESGFNPHDVSYADAIGLMQMIPPTTKRVAPKLGLEYTDDLLYDPETNVRVGAWYIGHLVEKFRGQIPLAAGSYNGGPRPMMKWLDKYGDRPIDEFVELVSFTQAREYMKKVTGIYAHYVMLYAGEDFTLPLDMDPKYLKNDVNY